MLDLCLPKELSFSDYDIPLTLTKGELKIIVEKTNALVTYKRQWLDEIIEKKVLTLNPKITVTPVEPVFPDKKITSHLYVEFSNPLEIEPDFSGIVYLIIPINIGIFINNGKSAEIIDILSVAKEKYALYGDPAHGFNARYTVSDVYPEKPNTDCITNSILELQIINNSGNWIEAHKVIFDCTLMKIFYNQSEVIMKAKMKISNQLLAETEFEEYHNNNYQRSLQIYQQKKFSISLDSSKFIMEAGI